MGLKTTLLLSLLTLLETLLTALSTALQTLFNLLYLPSNLNPNLCAVYTLSKDWKKHTAFAFKPNSPQCWLLKYSRSEAVDYCQSADVSLYHVDKDNFYFVKTKPGVDLYNVEQFPFHYKAQHDNAVELISVQHGVVGDYLRTVNKDHTGANLLILHSTGRCGSTLAAAMIYKTQQAVVISEPSVLYSVLMYHKDNNIPFTSSETHSVVADTLRLLAPDVTQQYVIKTHSAVTQTLPLLQPALPGISEIFMCRNVKQTAYSFKKIFGEMMTHGIWDRMTKIFLEEKYLEMFRKYGQPGFDIDQSIVFMMVVKIYLFTVERSARSDRVESPETIELFRYEELKADSSSFTKRLLAACNIAEEHVSTALSALEQDSQRNSELSREQQWKCDMISERAMRVGRDIAQELGLTMDLEGHMTLRQ